MTKEEFKNYNGLLHCKSCGTKVPKIHIEYRKVYKNGDIARCNVCEWIKRHTEIPCIDGFGKSEIIIALHFFLYEESVYINDLANKLNRTLDATIRLFKELKIGNKKCLVRIKCEYCNEDIEKPISVYLSNNNLYCSKKCYWKDKTNKMAHGENSPFYKRIKTECANCGKSIYVTPYHYNTKNSFGDNHNFCSKECYWEYRGKYYIGEKSHMTNHKYSDEELKKIRLTVLNNSRNAKRFDSKIQLRINDILDKNNIKYEREYIIGYYAVDNYLTDYNLIIEIMGDYWHSNPLKYNEEKYKINETQRKGLQHDKQKHTYIRNYQDIEILYLWETDINTRLDMCEKLILEYINNKGKLENYHSFNWESKSDSLFLCNKLIIPYQDMKIDEYRNLIKKTG